MINNRLFTRNNRLFLSAAAENIFISEILTFYAIPDKDIQEPIILPLFVFTNRLYHVPKTDLREIIEIKNT